MISQKDVLESRRRQESGSKSTRERAREGETVLPFTFVLALVDARRTASQEIKSAQGKISGFRQET